MKIPQISIIVPVYKAEEYLHECIESVLVQSYKNWELLLVDDGSPDNSGDICDKYAVKDSRIRVFHKQNGGVSSARNLALKKMRGEWVTFLDSDDKLYSNALQTMLETVYYNNLDVLQFSFNREWKLGEEGIPSTEVMPPQKYVNSTYCNVSVWGNCIRTSIVTENQIYFNESLKLGEDQIFVFDVLKCSYRVKRIAEILYFYYDNKESVMNNPKVCDILDLIMNFTEYKKINELSEKTFDNMLLVWLYYLIYYAKIPFKNITELYKKACIIHCGSWNSIGVKLLYKMSRLNVYFGVATCFLIHRLKNKLKVVCLKLLL